MTLTPTDMLAIQSAIDAYEHKFPHRPSPSAAEALAWWSGNSWQRALLWFKAVLKFRVKPVSIPKKVTIKYKAPQLGSGKNPSSRPPLRNAR
jgi:hypothetical protein